MLSRRGNEVPVGANELVEIRSRLTALAERLEALERGPSASGTNGGLSRLSETERRIATLVAFGRSDREVGERLFLSPKSVEWSLAKIYRKLGVRSRTELAAQLASATSLGATSRSNDERARERRLNVASTSRAREDTHVTS